MLSLLLYILGFIGSSAVIIFSGVRLSKYGDIIATQLNMGKAWFGLIMMAAVTSLPELFIGVSSILIVESPDIAVGDVMGSCAFNLLILAILDFFVKGKPLSSQVRKTHVLAGFFGIFLLTHAVIAIVFGHRFPEFQWFKGSSLLLIILYVVSILVIFKNEQKTSMNELGKQEERNNAVLSMAVKRYLLFALLVISGAIALPYFADHLAEQTGLGKSFVGTLLVAATTSLPELTVSIAAVRLGSADIAVGNLLGSNIFNMLILALDDLMYVKGPLFSVINSSHALSGLVALLMTSVAGIGILYSSNTKRFALGIDAIIIILLYFTLILSLYRMG